MNTLSTRQYTTQELAQAGQSPWLDSISRELLRSGRLKELIEEKGLLGVTSNPTIFEKAITTPGGGYEKDIKSLFSKGAGTLEVYDALTVSDIQKACDLFAGVFASSFGEHGFVSLEVRPDLAHCEKETVEDAMRLFTAVNRPNVMIKVPATPEGVRAFRELTANGVNVNVTLIFSLSHYKSVLNAYIEGLELYAKRGGDVAGVNSVASVFVSRFDSTIDARIKELSARESDAGERKSLEQLYGKAAVANAKIIYQSFLKEIRGGRWKRLEEAGANVQKVLWGSTSVKNPAYSDLLYVETLIGHETVNTMPSATLDALLDHGKVRPGTIEEDIDEAYEAVEKLKSWGIDLEEIAGKLQHDGLLAFMASFDSLMKTLEGFRPARKISAVNYKISVDPAVENSAPWNKAAKEKWVERFFKLDPSLWKEDAEHQKVINNRLGWVHIADKITGALYEIDELKKEIRRDKIKFLVLLGMGGSSLAPEVMSLICDREPRSPRFFVLDTTDPASIAEVEAQIDLQSTLFIAASKSGSTVETTSQYRYFYDRVSKQYGKSEAAAYKAGRHFIAITDDGSRLEAEAYEKKFRKVFINPTDIGGRYSALSFFGLVPAALMGIDARKLLQGAKDLLQSSRAEADPRKNNPFALGLLLGTLAKQGKDKLTIWTDKKLQSFGAWLEQLIAESTGKEGLGILPVDGETPGNMDVYGKDRVFLILKQYGTKSPALEKGIAALRKAKAPLIICEWKDGASVGAEFLRWEIITSIACAALGVNPFDEPNVKESKDNTTRLLTIAEKEGRKSGFANFQKIKDADFESFFGRVGGNGYVALLAYIRRSPQNIKALAKIQARIRDQYGIAVTAGFGPRYLHSIGQFYKGGPLTGKFIVLVNSDARDLKIPGAKFTFSQLKFAQAAGDCQAVSMRELPLLSIDLGKDPLKGLEAFEKALGGRFKERAGKISA